MVIFAIGIYREVTLAGKPEADVAILNATAGALKQLGYEVTTINPYEFNLRCSPDIIFSMARGRNICARLAKLEANGTLVINSPEAIQATLNRRKCYEIIQKAGAIIPPTKIVKIKDLKKLNEKSILKRPERHEFTTVISNDKELRDAKKSYKKQGLEEIVVQKFIDGAHIKYYGVGDKIFLPDEIKSYDKFTIKKIKAQATMAARALRLKVYGGDIIFDGEIPYLVDINDWPSFSAIKEIAAKEIAKLIDEEYKKR